MTAPPHSAAPPLIIRTVDDPLALRETVAAALDALPHDLGRRATLLTESEELAHQLRRFATLDLVEPALFYGVQTSRPAALAGEILARAGRPIAGKGELSRALHLRALFEDDTLDGKLAYFDTTALRRPGYVDAFVRTIGTLERAGLGPTTLGRLNGAGGDVHRRLRDVHAVWREVELRAGADEPRLTAAGTLIAATHELTETPASAAPFGPVIVVLSSDPSSALLDFLAALPECVAFLLDAQPPREGTRRWQASTAIAADVASTAAPPGALGRLHDRLFRVGRGAGPTANDDGSVVLEEYPSIDEEVEATAGWILERIEAGTAIEDMLIVATHVDLYAPLIEDRLARRDSDRQHLVVRVLDGRRLTGTPTGSQVLGLLRVLDRNLPADEVIPLLVRAVAMRGGRRSSSEVRTAVIKAGILGGAPHDETGALEWETKLAGWIQETEARLASLPVGDGTAFDVERDRSDLERALDCARELAPLLTPLARAAALLNERATLRELWPELRALVDTWNDGDELRILAEIDGGVRAFVHDAVARDIRGRAALDFIVQTIEALRITERHRQPAVAIASPRAAAGLAFEATRLIGIAEGEAPRAVHDDPVLPDEVRADLENIAGGAVIERTEDAALAELHAIHRAARGAQQQLAMSAPRQWCDGTDRELSGVFLEAQLALGRPPGSVETRAGAEARRAWSVEHPVLAAAVADRVASFEGHVAPASWLAPGSALDLVRMRELHRLGRDPQRFAPVDGDLSRAWRSDRAPGLDPSQPLSATRLRTLLECPHKYMLESLLGFKEPERDRKPDAIDPLTFGSTLHEVMEDLFNERGEAICAGEQSLEHWQEYAATIAGRVFDRLVAHYPLRGTHVRSRERRRFMTAVARLVVFECELGPRTFVGAELLFGSPESLALPVSTGDDGRALPGDDRQLYTRGKIDRVDALADGTLVVRDYKSGKRKRIGGRDRMQSKHDIQIATYGRALTVSRPGATVNEGAYVHPTEAGEMTRRFAAGQWLELQDALSVWLSHAHDLLLGGVFPRTPNKGDCRFCHMQSYCGSEGPRLSSTKAAGDAAPAAASAYISFRKRAGV